MFSNGDTGQSIADNYHARIHARVSGAKLRLCHAADKAMSVSDPVLVLTCPVVGG